MATYTRQAPSQGTMLVMPVGPQDLSNTRILRPTTPTTSPPLTSSATAMTMTTSITSRVTR